MNHSPLIRSCSLIASLTFLGMGSAWSAPDVQEKTTAGKSKAVSNAKASKSQTAKVAANRNSVNLKLAKSDSLKFAPAAASAVTVNPYFINQPAAILPKSVAPYVAQAAVAPVVAAPAVAPAPLVPSVAIAAPSSPSAVVAPAAAPVPAMIAAVAPAPVVAPPVIAAQPVAVVVKPVAPQIAAVAKPASAPVAAYQPWTPAAAYRNPYLAYQQQPMMAAPAPVYTPAPVTLPDTGKLLNSFNDSVKSLLPFQPAPSAPATAKPAAPATSIVSDASSSVGSLFTSLKMMLPLTGDSNILPTIKKVYPTGEKPLVVINFKCPTEVIGITPPPMKLLHEALNFGFDGLNKTNLLSFNLQQVCS